MKKRAGALLRLELFRLVGQADVYQVTEVGELVTGRLWCAHSANCDQTITLKISDKVILLSAKNSSKHDNHAGLVNKPNPTSERTTNPRRGMRRHK